MIKTLNGRCIRSCAKAYEYAGINEEDDPVTFQKKIFDLSYEDKSVWLTIKPYFLGAATPWTVLHQNPEALRKNMPSYVNGEYNKNNAVKEGISHRLPFMELGEKGEAWANRLYARLNPNAFQVVRSGKIAWHEFTMVSSTPDAILLNKRGNGAVDDTDPQSVSNAIFNNRACLGILETKSSLLVLDDKSSSLNAKLLRADLIKLPLPEIINKYKPGTIKAYLLPRNTAARRKITTKSVKNRDFLFSDKDMTEFKAAVDRVDWSVVYNDSGTDVIIPMREEKDKISRVKPDLLSTDYGHQVMCQLMTVAPYVKDRQIKAVLTFPSLYNDEIIFVIVAEIYFPTDLIISLRKKTIEELDKRICSSTDWEEWVDLSI